MPAGYSFQYLNIMNKTNIANPDKQYLSNTHLMLSTCMDQSFPDFCNI